MTQDFSSLEPEDRLDAPLAPSTGELELEDRVALRRIHGLSTELTDVTEVEYRQLRLEKVVLVGVWTEGTATESEASLTELARLAETAGSQVLDGLVQRRDRPDPATYIGSGKVNELSDVVLATGADTVICDGELSPGQLQQLEARLKVKVIDRTALILDIFAQHARSKEGKAQVELAQLQYLLPRLRGWGQTLSRQAGGRAGGGNGGVGLRGPGETKLETDRRRIRAKISKLRKEIAALGAVPSVAIAGYTNAGKSSLLNAITGAGVLVEDALFATLDATTRRSETPCGQVYTLTDTVGFVRHLPHQLVEAFRSTLDEVADADLLVHVVDGADPLPEWQVNAVREVLADIGRRRSGVMPPELVVVNKTDAIDEVALVRLRHLLPGAVFVSARSGAGLDELRERIAELLPKPQREMDVLVPYARGELVSRVYTDGEVLAEEHTEHGTQLKVKVYPDLAGQLEAFQSNTV